MSTSGDWRTETRSVKGGGGKESEEKVVGPMKWIVPLRTSLLSDVPFSIVFHLRSLIKVTSGYF